MKLVPFGIYGAYPYKNGGTSSYLLSSGETKLMLDFGSGALSRLQKIITPTEIDAIILTHLHYDHMLDMLPLIYYISLNKLERITVYLPKTDCVIGNILNSCGCFDLVYIYDGMTANIGDVQVIFYQLKHSVLSYGVKVVGSSSTFAYTGDTVYCSNLEALIAGSDCFVCDCSIFKNDVTPSSPHIAVETVVELAKKFNSKIMMSHFMTNDFSRHREVATLCDYVICEEEKEYTV